MSQIDKKWLPLAVGLILLIFIGTFTVTQAQTGGDVQQFQQGTGKCSVVAVTINSVGCKFTVTFSPAFSSVPDHFGATYQGKNQSISHFEQLTPVSTVYFQSDNGETWTNMPVALTEIYGTTTHESSVAFANFFIDAIFNVGCITPSSGVGAVLRPQYSTDGSTWFPLSANAGVLDVDVNGGNCAFGLPATSAQGAVANAAISAATFFLRVVGLNGGGVGDNPKFNNIYLQFFSQFIQPVSICIPQTSTLDCFIGANLPTKAAMDVVVFEFLPPIGTDQFFAHWFAYLCIKGGTAC